MFLGRDMGHQRDYSEEVAEIVDEEVRKLIETAHDEAWDDPRREPRRPRRPGPRAAREGDARQGGRSPRSSSRSSSAEPARSGCPPPVARSRTARRSLAPRSEPQRVSQRLERVVAERALEPRRRADRRQPRPSTAPPTEVGIRSVTDSHRPARRRMPTRRSTPSVPRRPSASCSIAIGEDPDRDGLRDTPARVARHVRRDLRRAAAGRRGRPHHDLRPRPRRDGPGQGHRGLQPPASTTSCRSTAWRTSATSRAPTAGSPGCRSSPGWSTSSPSARRCRSG